MNIQLRVHDPSDDNDPHSLYQWLGDAAPRLRADGVHLRRLGAAPRPGEMGGAFDVIQFVFDSSVQLGALAVAIATWRAAHATRGESSLTVERDGRRVTLTGVDVSDPDAVRRALEELLREDPA
ncbi:effector-associated constant component EACC1 [Streptomyces buecherae]|uniref:effector-associated constant component EACC1 n=1 Tax=Streptomyces buecherae TaxID=2763006 RepID=UPI001C266915|nr:hypothetical protein [Streptomyces buecherae]